MKTVTFYSYKGGVGRTLAAANFAVYLSKLGMKAVLIDFDFEAPGLDSKFPSLTLKSGFRGLLDYILDYQLTGKDPGPISDICYPIQISAGTSNTSVSLIPAGDYLTPEYEKKLNQLDWHGLFQGRQGVAFFQEFLNRVKAFTSPDFIIVDSRTGLTEVSGLCTQQLADEVVVLSSLSSESVKVTKYISDKIENSEIAKALGKKIDVKVVVSRVPSRSNIEKLQADCCRRFGVKEEKLFFLFSDPSLELRECVAMQSPDSESGLVDNYVRLFNGLQTELASDSIKAEIQSLSAAIFSTTPDIIEARVQELSTLYPHPEVIRVAMRFFRLTRNAKKTRQFAKRLLQMAPNDGEAAEILARYYLDEGVVHPTERTDAVRFIRPLYNEHKLNSQELLRFAVLLERIDEIAQSFEVAMELCKRQEALGELAADAFSIAARTGLRLGHVDVVRELVKKVPKSELSGPLGAFMVAELEKSEDFDGAFEIALRVVNRDPNTDLIRRAAQLAKRLGRVSQLEEVLVASDRLRMMARHPGFKNELVEALSSSGLSRVAKHLKPFLE